MNNIATKTYHVAVIERAIAFYKIEAEDARAAAGNWQDGEYEGRDDEALDTEGPSSIRERQPDGSWRKVPQSEWAAEPPTVASGIKPYSVLLLYPDYIGNYGEDTYYTFVEAANATDAVAGAQRQAVADQSVEIDDPTDFYPLLVTEGHHASEPLFNK